MWKNQPRFTPVYSHFNLFTKLRLRADGAATNWARVLFKIINPLGRVIIFHFSVSSLGVFSEKKTLAAVGFNYENFLGADTVSTLAKYGLKEPRFNLGKNMFS